jgi:hypothetical protein
VAGEKCNRNNARIGAPVAVGEEIAAMTTPTVTVRSAGVAPGDGDAPVRVA